jgi:hypothetical protein
VDKKDVKMAAATGDIEGLAEGSRSPDRRVRRAALKALAQLGTSEAVDAIAATALTAVEAGVALDALDRLYEVDDLRVVPAQRRIRWLKGEIDEEPGTEAPRLGSVLADQAPADIEIVTPQPEESPVGEDEPLAIVGGDRPRVGETAELVLRIAKWPDPRLEAVTVTVGYWKASLFQHEEDTGVHTTLVGTAMAHPSLSMGQRSKWVTVAKKAVSAAEIAGDGRLALRFKIPDGAPPSLPGVVSWRAQADVQRNLRAGRNHLIGFQVDPAPLDFTDPGPRSVDPDDWLLRLCNAPGQSYEDCLIPIGAPRNLKIQLDAAIVHPGDELAGRIAVRAEADSELPAGGLLVAIECWRGSEKNRTSHRMFSTAKPLDRPMSAREHDGGLPFRIAMPTKAELHAVACPKCPKVGEMGFGREESVPATFRGTDSGRGLDDVRWRVVVMTTSSSAHDPSWWSAAEVIVAPPDR